MSKVQVQFKVKTAAFAVGFLVSFLGPAAGAQQKVVYLPKTGDVLAISETNADPSTIFFEAATSSRFGHIGVVLVRNGKTSVVEANPPALQETPIKSFLARSQKGDTKPNYALVTPVKALNPSEQPFLSISGV